MIWFIIAVAIAFGYTMGVREAMYASDNGAHVQDARFRGVAAGAIMGALALSVLLTLWGLGAAYWWLINL
jgi:hypothetical protein